MFFLTIWIWWASEHPLLEVFQLHNTTKCSHNPTATHKLIQSSKHNTNTIQTNAGGFCLVYHGHQKPGVGCPKYRWVGFTHRSGKEKPEVQNSIDNKKMPIGQDGAAP